MSLLPSLVAQVKQRTAPPPVPPLIDKTKFESHEAYATYMKRRRQANERLREFNRPARGASKSLVAAVTSLRTRERRIFFGCNVETGRKGAPATPQQLKRSSIQQSNEEQAADLPKLTSAKVLHAAITQQSEHAGVSLSQVRRAVTAANQHDSSAPTEWPNLELVRERRRYIKQYVSATRPEGMLKRKRHLDAERKERRPRVEARQLQRVQKAAQMAAQKVQKAAQKAAQREAAVRLAQAVYDHCQAEEQQARELGADDLWFLIENRLDAAKALSLAKWQI